MSNKERFWSTLIKIGMAIVILCLILPLGMYAVTGWSSRMMADDYCFSAKLQAEGFVGAQVDWYQTWTNRYSTTLLISFSEYLGRINFQLWPVVLVFAIAFSFFIGFLPVFRQLFDANHTWMAAMVSALLVFMVFFTSQNRLQSLFWRSGSVTYAGSLVIPGIMVATILSHSRWSHRYHRFMVMLCLVIAFFGAGFSESYAAVQTTVLGVAFVAVVIATGVRKQSEIISRIIGGLVGSLIGMVVIILSPGNHARQSLMTPTRDIGIVLLKSMRFGMDMLKYTIQSQPVPLLFMAILVIILTFLLYDLRSQVSWKTWVWIPISLFFGYLFVAALCAPSIYAQSSYPETRVLLLGKFVLLMMILGVCIPIGIWIKKMVIVKPLLYPWATGFGLIVMVILSVYPLRGAWQARIEQEKLVKYAAQWDERDHLIREQALLSQDIIVEGIQSQAEVEELKPEVTDWVNRCAADYYGVRTIQAVNPTP